MPKRFTKATLPHKTCAACGRTFAWRKKWAAVWDEVRYCSDRCRKAKRGAATSSRCAAGARDEA